MNNFTQAIVTSVLMMFAASEALAVDHLTKMGIASPGNRSINEYAINVSLQNNTILITPFSTAGITSVESDNTDIHVYYNLQGLKIAAPTNEIYIKKGVNRVSKIIL